jgi:predicted dienelactone hydrolase
MSTPYHKHRLLFSLPRDFIRRRRFFRRISNIAFIMILSLVAGYVITRPVGGTGFQLSKSAQQTASFVPATPLPAFSVASHPARGVADGYHVQNGPFAVTEISDIVLHDGKRNKDLHVRIFYPNSPGPYPVIVFSHGAVGSQTCCDSLTRHWATYGYVTLQPTHGDSAVQRRNAGEENIRFMPAVRAALKNPALWESRPQDISFVLDSLPALENRVPGLAGKIDAARIGVGGHSMGSYTAEAIAGATVDLPGHPGASFADPRVKAVLCLSPQGPGQFGLTDHSFAGIKLPFIGMTGSLDSLGPVASASWHKTPFERSPPGDKFHVFIDGANHMSFITVRTLSPARGAQGEAILGYTNSASLAFWDVYLKGEAQARQFLQSDALQNSSHGAVTLSRR